MNVKIIIFCTFVFLSFSSKGQADKISLVEKNQAKQLVNNGISLYDSGLSKQAYMEFKAAIAKNPTSWEAYYWLANTEFKLNDFFSALENAETAYGLTEKKNDADLNFLLGTIKHNLGEIDKALIHYEVSRKSLGESLAKEYEIPVLIEQCNFAKNEKIKGTVNKRFLFSNKINSMEEEYSPILTQNGLHLFFTGRNSESTGNNQNLEDERYFEDIYHFEWNNDEKDWKKSSQSLEGINTEGFDALNYISKNGKYALGTINTSSSKEKTTKSSDIFEITTEEELLFESATIINNKNINTSYFEGSAVISDTILNGADYSQFLYFVSDRQAEQTLTDIYCIEKKNGTWMKNETKLKTINSSGRETTPFITPNGRFLFFSSDGLPGMGGYDIYYSENKNGVWGPPINLGAAYNTVNDDTHFQIYPELKKAVMAGINQTDGVFNYDIFQIDLSDSDFTFLKD